MKRGRPFLVLFAFFLASASPGVARAVTPYADVGVSAELTSNAYLDRWREWDFIIAPQLAAGLDLNDLWTLGYSGGADLYTRNTELAFQRHALHVLLEPTWGEEDENAFFLELSAQAQANTDSYDAINFFAPALEVGLRLEPAPWFRWELSEKGSYRLFYNDTASDSLDLWTDTSLMFTLPSRTTLGPIAAYGFRYYPRQDPAVADNTVDQQIEVGARITQALGERGGLRAEYRYLYDIGINGMVERKMLSDAAFGYLGEEFLFSGHRAELGYKQLFGTGWQLGLEVAFETREYDGWPISDDEEADAAAGNGASASAADVRSDQRLEPGGWLEYGWAPSEDASRGIPEVTVRLGYSFLRQWSNDRAYDTYRHLASLSAAVSW
jgi:hypothetical protein